MTADRVTVRSLIAPAPTAPGLPARTVQHLRDIVVEDIYTGTTTIPVPADATVNVHYGPTGSTVTLTIPTREIVAVATSASTNAADRLDRDRLTIDDAGRPDPEDPTP